MGGEKGGEGQKKKAKEQGEEWRRGNQTGNIAQVRGVKGEGRK